MFREDSSNIQEVDQIAVKEALKILLTNKEHIIGRLYEAHDRWNKTKFGNILPMAVITIERMDNRTLATYSPAGSSRIGVDNHIRFNENFIALNNIERVELTMAHEMIHEWQDTVIYSALDKKPREWHNKDFREQAAKIGIPCEGKHCGTGPANMPKAKSYNRKFICGCVASNGYPMTIWSTREIHAKCTICGQEYTEVKKIRGATIPVTASHINSKRGDIVQKTLALEGFDMFKRFKDKDEFDSFLEDKKGMQTKSGHYQKQHTLYEKDWRYWIAWNSIKASESLLPAATYVFTPPSELKRAIPKREGTD